MNSFFKIVGVLWVVTFCTPSFAKIHIEPYLGYSLTVIGVENFSKGIYETTQKLGSSSYYHGVTSGVRLGYSSLNLAVGLDITFGFWKSLYKQGVTDFKNKQTIFPVLPGLFVSYKLPLLFRAYASLIPQASVIVKTQNSSRTCSGSRATKFGISYLSLPFLSINFEYLPVYIGTGRGGSCESAWSHTGTVYGNITF